MSKRQRRYNFYFCDDCYEKCQMKAANVTLMRDDCMASQKYCANCATFDGPFKGGNGHFVEYAYQRGDMSYYYSGNS